MKKAVARITRALKCQTLGCTYTVCRKKKLMHTFPSIYIYSGTEVVLNRPGYFCVITYTVA